MTAVDDAVAIMQDALFKGSEARKEALQRFAEAIEPMTQAEKEEVVQRCDEMVLALDIMKRRGPPTGPAS